MRIIYTRTDGTLAMAFGARKEDLDKVARMVDEKGERSLTQKEYEDHVWEKLIPKDAINPVRLPDDYVLPDREFRNAWKHNGDSITHDLEKAREIQLDRIRHARELQLADLDVAFMRALEDGDTATQKSVIEAKKKLRDITEALKNAKLSSIEDVKKSFPAELV